MIGLSLRDREEDCGTDLRLALLKVAQLFCA